MHRNGVYQRVLFDHGCSLLFFVLVACCPAPYQQVVCPVNPNGGYSKAASLTQVYFYPREFKTTEQQSRDHYDCYIWAVKKTGFDPGQVPLQPEQRVRVVPMPPPGHDTAAFAIAGMVLGALFAGPRHSGQGALIGTVGGAIAGAASDSARQEQARQIEQAYNERDQRQNAQIEAKSLDFRRAMSACLEGRGYTVK